MIGSADSLASLGMELAPAIDPPFARGNVLDHDDRSSGSGARMQEVWETAARHFLAPIARFLADESVTEIMVNGPKHVYIEREGRIEPAGVEFVDDGAVEAAAIHIAQFVGRRVSREQPILDGRLPAGHRVSVVLPPISGTGATITIRKFSPAPRDPAFLLESDAITAEAWSFLERAIRDHANILISGGTGTGKTTVLGALASTFERSERVIVLEDTRELQLGCPHVVRLEARPADRHGRGAVTIRDLFVASLRMRPERIIVGEVRGPEAFDLLQAMNTGHDGSMGTLHANNPREALSRCESMITMGGFSLPSRTIREMICASIDVIVQAARLRDGSRRITHITEVMGMEGDTIITQDIFLYEMVGEDANGKIIGKHRSTGIGRPKFWERARYYNEEKRLAAALDAAESKPNT